MTNQDINDRRTDVLRKLVVYRVCEHCGMALKQHADNLQCLFASTHYYAAKDNTYCIERGYKDEGAKLVSDALADNLIALKLFDDKRDGFITVQLESWPGIQDADGRVDGPAVRALRKIYKRIYEQLRIALEDK